MLSRTDHRGRLTSCGGFTAIELVIVIGIMLIMMGMAVPAILPALRHGQINTAVNDIMSCWRQARILAMTHSPPAINPVPYFGILIQQTTGSPASVTLIYDSVNSGTPNYLVQGQNPADPTTYNAAHAPVAQYTFSQNVLLSTSTSATTQPTVQPASIIIYSQYSTGLALDPADVAAGRGAMAAPTSIGITGMQNTSMGITAPTTTIPSVCPFFLLQTVDFNNSPRRGFSTAFSIYHAGFSAAQDQ